MKKHYNWRLIGSLGLFIFIIITLSCYTFWWFNGCDDFHGLYLGFRTKTWRELLYFFCDGHINQDIGPSNYSQTHQATTFFSTYYRPLYCVYLTLQYWLFGTNAYWYFLCNVFFHAINSVLLFNIFLYLTSIIPALLGALFFAFHPQIGYRFGAIVNLHYYVNVMLVLLTMITFKKYLETDNIRFFLIACVTFFIALFTRESSIVLPVIMFIGAWRFRPTVPFFIIAIGFLGLRMYLYPLAATTHGHSWSLLHLMQAKSQELLVFLYDCFGLSWLPWGHKILRGGILCMLAIIFFWLFIHNRKKLPITLMLVSASLMLWPALIGCYSPRYIYEALPFIIAAFILCFQGYKTRLIPLKKLGLAASCLLVTFNIFFTLECLQRREIKMKTVGHAVQELVASPLIANRALCFLSYPMDGLGDQPADIIRVLRKDTTLPIYCDTATALVQADSNIITPTRWKNIVSAYYTKNYVTITPIENGFRFTSSDPTKVHFLIDDNQSYSLGKKIILAKQTTKSGEVITDFTLIIDEQYLNQKPVFVAWNYEKPGFDVIGE
jgi:hypothetical protein